MKQKCKKLLSIILSLTMLFSITAGIDNCIYAATQNALWFMDDLKITQLPGGNYSHKGTQNFDVVGVKNQNIKAPFDCKIVKIHKGTTYGNTVIIESTSKVNYADGTYDYMSMCFAHDNDISNLSVGKTIKQGQIFYQTGTYGNVSGRHSHVTVIKGKYKNDMWTKNSYGNYCSPNAINPTKGLFITNSTNVVDTKGLSFKKVSSSSGSQNITNPSVTVKSISNLTTTSVQLNFTANNPSKVTIKTVGVQIRRKGESTWKTKSEAMNKNYTNATSVPMWWTVGKGKEFDTTLYPGITYEYRAYVVYNSKNYYSSTSSFTTKGTHSHSVSSEITKNPTCTEYGTRKYYCTICGVTTSNSTISPKGHSWDSGTLTKNPTCTQKGIKTYNCKNCNATKTVTISTSNHKYIITTTKATASSDGKIVKTCTVCKKSSSTVIPKASNISLSATTYTYDGKVKTPSITVKDRTGKALKNGTDYSVSYASGRKNVGKYAVTVKFKGNYSGSKTIYFLIKPKGTSISSISPGKKKFTVKWKKPSTSITGYQIQYSTSSKFSNAKNITVSKNSTTSKSITNLSVNKKYYVRVRTYKTVGSTKYYSSWSSAKYVITNK